MGPRPHDRQRGRILLGERCPWIRELWRTGDRSKGFRPSEVRKVLRERFLRKEVVVTCPEETVPDPGVVAP